jgi:hypothetical protein
MGIDELAAATRHAQGITAVNAKKLRLETMFEFMFCTLSGNKKTLPEPAPPSKN